MKKVTLPFIINLLNNKELWPKNFTWDFGYCHKVENGRVRGDILGLLIEMKLLDIPGYFENKNSVKILNDYIRNQFHKDLGLSEEEAYFLFFEVEDHLDVDREDIRPEMIADFINRNS